MDRDGRRRVHDRRALDPRTHDRAAVAREDRSAGIEGALVAMEGARLEALVRGLAGDALVERLLVRYDEPDAMDGAAADTWAAVLDAVRRFYAGEIVVIDDGSTDETPRVLARRDDVSVLHTDRNCGYGCARGTSGRCSWSRPGPTGGSRGSRSRPAISWRC